MFVLTRYHCILYRYPLCSTLYELLYESDENERSVSEGRTDLDTAKADIGQRMSDVERRADLDQTVWNFAS